MRRLWFVFLLFSLMCSEAGAQAIEGVAFFRGIHDRYSDGKRFVDAIGPYPEGHQIALKAIPLQKKRRRVYAAATLTSEAVPSKIVFVFQRIVDPKDPFCSAEEDQDFAAKGDLTQIKKPQFADEGLSKVALVGRWIVDKVGDSEIGAASVKLKVVTTEPGQRTYYDYRYVSCAGTLRVWVTDQNLNLLAPAERNSGITLHVHY
jgi:hypothetical protein